MSATNKADLLMVQISRNCIIWLRLQRQPAEQPANKSLPANKLFNVWTRIRQPH